MSIFQYDFMVRALVAVLITGVTAPALGIYLVQRRMSLIGDGIGHIALTGVGVGLLTGGSPVLTAVLVAAAGAVAVELIRERGRTSGDIALAILFYGGISGGVFLVSLAADRSNANLIAYLFGSPLSASRGDLVVMAVLGAAVLLFTVLLRPWLFAVCHDEEYARVSGLPVRTLNLLLAVGTAVTVTVAMRAVGLLLVSALMVIPVATAQQVARGFRATMHVAMLLGLVAAGLGIWISGARDTAPGATIVLVAVAGFLLAAVGAGAWRSVRRVSGRPATPGRPSVPVTGPTAHGAGPASSTPPAAPTPPTPPTAPAPTPPAAPRPPTAHRPPAALTPSAAPRSPAAPRPVPPTMPPAPATPEPASPTPGTTAAAAVSMQNATSGARNGTQTEPPDPMPDL